MKVIGEVPHPSCKITLYAWNNRYIVKVEAGYFEQTYKINEYDITSEDDLKEMLNGPFLDKVMRRFEEMAKDWGEAVDELDD
ncbi:MULTISPECIES: hypothetical protein [unclassified Siphonobacter]|uniref:hypothetical protein n=1 Tax=unclassified Siphonobacter TaxID=2635712 RepID=UPI000CB560EF|nr:MULTISPECIES: hypothetical protein [unclassified Siphonobacter]MDQ1089065.1 putative HD phosphohydrolase [Siphonobacter sp. SORGH_AS_1065]MDR6195239.1 putative HD phosphohydrolase [Siphonobacter sp. SORGH_AS_0500]PKK38302.1 hypothetical protein BWI96_00465 [Siphonobacter sp. SORGH_AS_0500]